MYNWKAGDGVLQKSSPQYLRRLIFVGLLASPCKRMDAHFGVELDGEACSECVAIIALVDYNESWVFYNKGPDITGLFEEAPEPIAFLLFIFSFRYLRITA